MGSPLAAAKQQLRSLMKQRLASTSPESVLTQSRQIFESLIEFKPYIDAKRVSIYLSMPSAEIQTDAIVRHALGSGKQVFVPYLHKSPLETPDTPSRVMDMVHLRDLQDYDSLKPDRWGIPSIDPATVSERQRVLGGPDGQPSGVSDLDFMLVPGVAFDLDDAGAVRRLGHGRGFYDFFLNRYAARAALPHGNMTPILLYGLALTEQLLSAASGEQIPMGPHDRRLDGLIIGNGQVKESTKVAMRGQSGSQV